MSDGKEIVRVELFPDGKFRTAFDPRPFGEKGTDPADWGRVLSQIFDAMTQAAQRAGIRMPDGDQAATKGQIQARIFEGFYEELTGTDTLQ